MYNQLKMSKYNFTVHDQDGNLILYNFLKGLTSLTKVLQQDVDKFNQLFLTDDKISSMSCNDHIGIVEKMIDLGILVDHDVNEDILYDAKNYEEIFDSKLTLTILTTGKCNFRCPYCFETPQLLIRESMSIDSQNALMQFVQKSISNHKALHVSWFGGEPLLTPEIIKRLSEKFIQMCNVRHLPFSADITTNGFLLDENMFDMLYKLKVYNYIITIDGSKEQHNKRRFTADGKGTYDTIMNNLLKIRDNKHYRFANIIIRVNMSRGFVENLDEFIECLASYFSEDPRFKFTFVPVVKFSGSSFPDDDIYSDHTLLFSHLFKNSTYFNKLYSEELKISSIISQPKCPAALKNSYVITPDLNVYKCNAHYNFSTNRIGYINSVGNLRINESIHRKWFLTSKFVQRMPDTCNDCFYLPSCYSVSAGCPVSYLKPTPEEITCPMKDEKQKSDIINTVLYAANKYPCVILEL